MDTTKIGGVEIETCDCKVCGHQSLMTGTKLCNNCWEMERRAKGFVVLNRSSNGFCQFELLDNALVHYKSGIKRKEPYMLLAIMKGKP